ncbi:cpna [Acrasis kona]|uniref:Cpna n=1 Tax=Acrasis kona TaxID=1008807 RepID=A0AAW2ZP42_9EUKA
MSQLFQRLWGFIAVLLKIITNTRSSKYLKNASLLDKGEDIGNIPTSFHALQYYYPTKNIATSYRETSRLLP